MSGNQFWVKHIWKNNFLNKECFHSNSNNHPVNPSLELLLILPENVGRVAHPNSSMINQLSCNNEIDENGSKLENGYN